MIFLGNQLMQKKVLVSSFKYAISKEILLSEIVEVHLKVGIPKRYHWRLCMKSYSLGVAPFKMVT
jgi:hypothetical protein